MSENRHSRGLILEEQVARIGMAVEAFDAQGWHRTGTDVDAASGKWLAAETQRIGLQADLEVFDLSRIVIEKASVEINGRIIEGLPAFDGGFTESSGVSGRLGVAGSDAEVGVLVLNGEAANSAAEELRRSNQHLALVAITVGRRPGLMAHNATHFNSPFGMPVLQVGSEERESLESAAASGAQVTVTASINRASSQSSNVVARWSGIDAEAAPVVVTTPRSCWWQCASERGSGIAAWLEVARKVVETEPIRPVWFVAFSGHELGHLGSDAFLERRPMIAEQANAWVHIGANVGGAAEPAVQIGASDADLLEMGRQWMATVGVTDLTLRPAGLVPGLESQQMHSRGGRVIGLVGGNAHFHLESDRWPDAADATAVAKQANAVANLVLSLANMR